MISVGLMTLAVVLVSRRTEPQPWYLLYLLPLTALLPAKRWFFWPLAIVSLGLLLTYTPFLYRGNWDWPVMKTKLLLVSGSVGLWLLWEFLKKINLRIRKGN